MNAQLNLQVLSPGIPSNCERGGSVRCSGRRLSPLLRSRHQFAAFALQSVDRTQFEQSISSELNSSIGSSPRIRTYGWSPRDRQIHALSFVACAAAISATWLCFSAIPTLLAFKRAARSMEKLMDIMREEIPGTMMAVRLSGMEISDLTMELSDIGQELTPGIRRSTRAIRSAEERLTQLTSMAPIGSSWQRAPYETGAPEPIVARTARSVREGIVKGRALIQTFFTLTWFSKVLLTYPFRAKERFTLKWLC